MHVVEDVLQTARFYMKQMTNGMEYVYKIK